MKFLKFDLTESQAVIELYTNTFADSEGKAEGKLIGSLVSDLITTTRKSDLVGFVAKSEDKVLGSIFFSRLVLPSNNVAFILSPVAIATKYQGKGLGQQLINFGIEYLKTLNVDIVFTYGDPNFYAKVGFKPISEGVVKAPLKLSYPEGWLAQSLNNAPIDVMKGSTHCVKALDNQQYW